MAEYAPTQIRALFNDIQQVIPAAELSGILGDSGHTYGYHRCRAVLPSDDYSVVLPKDRLGDSWVAAALDISLGPVLMKTVTARLLAAAKAGDPRLKAVREFCGTTNGTTTHSYDLSDQREAYGEWDDSHLWHVHVSFYRQYTQDMTALSPVADVITGKPLVNDQEEEMALSPEAQQQVEQAVANQLARYFAGQDGHQHQLETLVREALATMAAQVAAIKAKVGA